MTFYCAKLDAAGGSQKALFATVKELAGLKEKPVYPSGQSDEELANKSAQFFINRISKIRTDLISKNCDYRDHFPLTESVTDFQILHDFSATCDSELLDIISVHGFKC